MITIDLVGQLTTIESVHDRWTTIPRTKLTIPSANAKVQLSWTSDDKRIIIYDVFDTRFNGDTRVAILTITLDRSNEYFGGTHHEMEISIINDDFYKETLIEGWRVFTPTKWIHTDGSIFEVMG